MLLKGNGPYLRAGYPDSGSPKPLSEAGAGAHSLCPGLVAAIKIFLALIDGRAAPGILADFLSLRRKQLFLFLRDGGIFFHKPRRHCFNATHEAVRVGFSFCNLRQSVFPFSGQLRACEGVGQDGDKVLAVFGGDTLLFPTSGQILWEGEDIHALDESYRGLLGYLPQEFGYYPGYTPRQFLRYVAALQCIPRKEADQRISELLELVGLSDAEHKKMRQLSGGIR